MKKRRGQVALYLMLVLVAVMLLALMNVDVFLSVRTKTRIENGGDAAALAAARWQGHIINEIGNLNIEHFRAAVKGDVRKCEEIEREQRRLALIEPVYALRRANEAAKRNGLKARDEFSTILKNHVKDIRLIYSGGTGDDGDPYRESYPGAWVDYATAIDNVVSEGLAIGPDNMEFYNLQMGHLLLVKNFYSAIAGNDWCWFYFYCYNALKSYSTYRDWGPLPDGSANTTVNSEIFSLHLDARRGALTNDFTMAEIYAMADRFNIRMNAEDFAETNLFADASQTWFFFDLHKWSRWFDGRRLVGDEDGAEFPTVGNIKPEYNVRGCAAVCRAMGTTESFTTDTTRDNTWSAAAKPFGTLEDMDGEIGPVTSLRGFVLPCMTDARLVAVDAVGGENLATADIYWVTHLRRHIGPYLLHGPNADNGCWYCAQLSAWEKKAFHVRGTTWLRYHSGECIRPTSGGNIGSGGTSHGH